MASPFFFPKALRKGSGNVRLSFTFLRYSSGFHCPQDCRSYCRETIISMSLWILYFQVSWRLTHSTPLKSSTSFGGVLTYTPFNAHARLYIIMWMDLQKGAFYVQLLEKQFWNNKFNIYLENDYLSCQYVFLHISIASYSKWILIQVIQLDQ